MCNGHEKNNNVYRFVKSPSAVTVVKAIIIRSNIHLNREAISVVARIMEYFSAYNSSSYKSLLSAFRHQKWLL